MRFLIIFLILISNTFANEVPEIKNIINLRGTAKIVPIKSLPNDGKVIDDIRDFGE